MTIAPKTRISRPKAKFVIFRQRQYPGPPQGLYNKPEQADECTADQRRETNMKGGKALIEPLLRIVGDRYQANFGGAKGRDRSAQSPDRVPTQKTRSGLCLSPICRDVRK